MYTEANPRGKDSLRLIALGIVTSLALAPLSASLSADKALASVRVEDVPSLKAEIEGATSDIEIELAPGVYTFNDVAGTAGQISTDESIKITLVGSVSDDEERLPTTEFEMGEDVEFGDRFIRADSASLSLRNIKLTGGANKNGGVSAFNVSVDNTIFDSNFTADSTAGGGAIRATGGSIDIEHSEFIGNSAGGSSDGGAVATQYGGGLRINDSVFDGNFRESGGKNQYGGAISVKQPSVDGSTVVITNSLFLNNVHTATGNLSTGGAIRIFGTSSLSSVLIDNCLFRGNKTTSVVNQSGGAIGFMTTTNSTISNSTFIDNTATRYGGAVYYENSSSNAIVNSTFVGNKASLGGSALSAYSSAVVVDSSTLLSNTVTTGGSASRISFKESVVAGTASYEASTASGVIEYLGVNLARKNGGQPAVNAADVFSSYTAATLEKVSETNYIAPVRVGGHAYKKLGDERSLPQSQNGVNRKSPLSDIGAAEAPVYSVTFDSAGGSSVESVVDIDHGSRISTPPEPTRDGYRFAAWTLNDAIYDFGSPVTSDFTLRATWTSAPAATFTVRFDSDGGSAVAPATVKAGDPVTKPQDPTRSGFEFLAWTLDKELYDFSSPVTSDMRLLATWKARALPEKPRPKITPDSLPKGSVGKAYTATVTAKGTGKPVLSLSGGKLPDGLKFDAKTGKITGKPVKTGTFGFTIKAKDAGGLATKQYSIIVEKAALGVCMEPRKVPVFSDTPLKHKFYKEIDWMECMKYATGWRMPAGKPEYRPQLNIERQAMAAFIFRMDADKSYRAPKVSPFADVKTTDKFYREIAWMWEKGYATGWAEPSGKPTFRSLEPLSREAMAAFIYRLEAAKHPSAKNYQAPAVSPLADMKKGMKFYREISWMYDEKLTTGNKTVTGKEFWPKDQLSRQAMAAFIYRLVTDYRVKN